MKKAPHHYQPTDVRQRQIAEAALEVIADQGLAAFTTRALAARIEISDGTIFRHFKNKREIVLAAMRRLEEELLLDSIGDVDDPLERIERLFRSRAQLLGGAQAVGRLVFSDILVQAAGDQGLAMWQSWRERTLAVIGTALSELRSDGRLGSDLPIPSMVRVILGTLLTFANQRAVTGGPIPELKVEIDAAWASLEGLLELQRRL